MTNREKQILQFMEKLHISREEAEQLFDDDADDYIGEQGEEMEKNAKVLRRYEQGDKPRKKMEKERKVDDVKLFLLTVIKDHLLALDDLEITGMKNEVELSFKYQLEDYSIKLTRHRKKKQPDNSELFDNSEFIFLY